MTQNRSVIPVRRLLQSTLWLAVSAVVLLAANLVFDTHMLWRHLAFFPILNLVMAIGTLAALFYVLNASWLYGLAIIRGPYSNLVQRILKRLPRHSLAISWSISMIWVVFAVLSIFLT